MDLEDECTYPAEVTSACIKRLPAVDTPIMDGQQEGTGLGSLLVEVLMNAVELYSMAMVAAGQHSHVINIDQEQTQRELWYS